MSSCNCCNWFWKDERRFLKCDPVTIVTGFVKKKRFYLSICIFCNWFWEKKYNFFTLEIVKQLMWWNDIRFFSNRFGLDFVGPKILFQFFLPEKTCPGFFHGVPWLWTWRGSRFEPGSPGWQASTFATIPQGQVREIVNFCEHNIIFCKFLCESEKC